MTDEELIEKIREAVAEGDLLVSWNLADAAADRIEQLVKDNHRWKMECEEFWRKREDAVDAKLARAVDALRLVTDACDEGKMVSLGAGGMTIDAQIRRSLYNQVPAWPIEEARAVLAELEQTE